MNLRDQILNAPQAKPEPVEVPEWGCTIFIRRLTAKERDAFEDSLTIQKGRKSEKNVVNFRARLLSLCIVDETGTRVFTDPADVEALGERDSLPIQRCLRIATKLNGFDDDELQELSKNS